MHESVLVYRMLEEIKPQLPPGCTLKRVSLELGEYSCVTAKTLAQLYDIAKAGTFAQGSRLKLIVRKNSSDIVIKSVEVI